MKEKVFEGDAKLETHNLRNVEYRVSAIERLQEGSYLRSLKNELEYDVFE